MSYTKGEWEVRGDDAYIVCGKKTIAAPINTLSSEKDSTLGLEEMLENAHLISAAPDMYEALEAFILYLEKPHPENKQLKVKALEVAEKALAKARGE